MLSERERVALWVDPERFFDAHASAWDAFVADLDPVVVERERMRAPGVGERPGSARSRDWAEYHAWVRERVRRRLAELPVDLVEVAPGRARMNVAARGGKGKSGA